MPVTELELYDIMQLDNKLEELIIMEYHAKKTNLKWVGAKNLKEYERVLESGLRAKVYVLDGNFPYDEHSSEDFLAPQAIDITRFHDEDPLIILYSTEGEEIAREKNVIYRSKKISTLELLEEVKELINQ